MTTTTTPTAFSTRERISHVLRRLGFGTQPELVTTAVDVDDAVSLALRSGEPTIPIPDLDPPATSEMARSRDQVEPMWRFWLSRLVAGSTRVEERMAWFWHDHFATDIRKVRIPWLMWQQHLTIRRHATGSFAELLHAIATDPAMLVYLDGVHNARGRINENFGREVMELFTIGRGEYTEQDVIEASRAFSGWTVKFPEARFADLVPGAVWEAVFLPFRHDAGEKTLLGRTGNLDLAAAVDILLEHPATATRIAAKLHRELTGLDPAPAEADALGVVFRRDYRIMDLIEAIAASPAFTSDEAIRSRIRTPLEKAVGMLQSFGAGDRALPAVVAGLEAIGYLPFRPPNVAGYPKGERLLGPHQLVHGFDLTRALPRRVLDLEADDLMSRLGIFDIEPETRAVLAGTGDPEMRVLLATSAPEFQVV